MVLPVSDKHVVINGHMVSERVSQVVEAIKAYEPEIDVEWQPPGAREGQQPAFRIVHRPRNGDEYILMFVQTEEEMTMQVLQKIIVNDQRNGALNSDEFEAWEKANQLIEEQKYMDMMEELNDVAAHILKTRKNTYKVNDNLIIKEGIPHNAAHMKD